MIERDSHAMDREVHSEDSNINTPSDLNGTASASHENEGSEYIGNDVLYKDEDVIRIGLINIRGVPESNQDPKNKHIKATIEITRFDHTGLTEINKQWNCVHTDHRWFNRIKQWWQHKKSIVSYNTKDINSDAYQPGGTISLTVGELTSRVYKTGKDKLLGRWSWTSYRGCRGIITTIITGYRPCRNMTGNNTNYLQHKKVLMALGLQTCPREKWLEDIAVFIKQRQQQNEQIIIMADFNEDVGSTRLKRWANELELREIITEKVQASPPTRNNGSVPIDGIFVSHSINAVKAGYSEFGLFQSDHRAVWLDVKEANLLGFKAPDIIRPSARRLQCGVPSVKKRWKQLYTTKLRENNLFNKQFQLEKEIQQSKGNITSEQIKRFESIMTIRLKCMAYAEKNCRKLKMGRLPYSPETSKAQGTIELLQGVITKKKGRKFSSRKLRRLEAKVGKFRTMNLSLFEAEEELKLARKQFWECIKNSKQLRQSFLERRAQELAHEKDTKKESELKQLIKREEQKDASRKIKFALNKLGQENISTLHVKRNGTTTELTSKYLIDQACLEENMQKYTQTKGTICTQEPLRSLLGRYGETELCNNILEGNPTLPEGTPEYVNDFMAELKKVTTDKEDVSLQISTSEFKEGWGKMKESTSSGKSGVHFGNLITCAEDDKLAQFESSIAQIPFMTGYSPLLWKEGTIVMIKKKAGNAEIGALRSIVLLEADYNFNNKILGKRAMAHAEEIQALAPEQYGSRKGKTAIDQALHKRLTYDIIRQHRLPAILCSNDAKSCYDRILHPMASLAYRRAGVPLAPVKAMLECIQEMKHHVRTSYGLSDDTFDTRDLEEKMQGILQGNGAAPTTWVLISSPLLNLLRKKGYCGKFMSPITKEKTHLVGFAFVDDTDLILLDMIDESLSFDEIAEQMQEAINAWENGLKTTGGAIVPHKSWLFPMDFKDTTAKAEFEKIEEFDMEFSVKDHNDIRRNLQKIPSYQGKETLGVHLAPDGNNEAAVTYLKQKASAWHDNIVLGQLQLDLAWQASQTTIMKSIEYPLPALTLSEDECKKIMMPIKKATLAKTSLNRTYPLALLYGPKDEGGLGFNDLFVTQGITHIQKFHQHHGWKTITDKLITVSMETTILELGIGRNIFELDYDKFQTLASDSWIKGLWKFCCKYSITIIDRITRYPPLLREGDMFLMEVFIHEGFTEGQLQKLNLCRMYLQVLRLSDIVNGNGDGFTQAYRMIKDPARKSKYTLPRVSRPGATSIKLWKKALKKTFGLRKGEISYTVGKWCYTPTEQWIWFYHETSGLIYQRFGALWRVWKRASRRGNNNKTFQIHYFNNALALPSGSFRATVVQQSHSKAKFTGWDKHHNSEELETAYEVRLEDFPIKNQLTVGDEQYLVEQIVSESLVAVSDGSYIETDHVGAAAWIIETLDQSTSMEGTVVVSGDGTIQNSYRSELFGILGILVCINKLCIKHRVRSGGLTLYCDGESAVKRIKYSQSPVSNNSHHFDVINSIQSILQEIPVTVHLKHIKGHQDKYMPYSNLDRPSQLNVLVDSMAKRAATDAINTQSTRRYYSLPFTKCEIFIQQHNGTQFQICSNMSKTIRQIIQQAESREYWVKKKNLHNTKHLVDWELRRKGLSNLPLHRSRWYSKFTSGFCGTGKMLKRYAFQDHSNCPRCNEPSEGTSHVLQCKHSSAEEHRTKSVEELMIWMDKSKVDPEISYVTRTIIMSWCEQRPIHTPQGNSTIDQAFRQQSLIGWKNFVEGFWSKKFTEVQTTYFVSHGIPNSAILLLSKVQRRIWHIAWSIWTQRNTYLHEARNSVHPQEEVQLNNEIVYEYRKGLEHLPPEYQPVFNHPLQQILTRNIQHRVSWLFGIWVARETIYPAYLSLPSINNPNNTLRFKFIQWKEKII